MSSVIQVDDGNFSIAQCNGTPAISWPFQRFGDKATWEWRAKFRIDQEQFRRSGNTIARYQIGSTIYVVQYLDASGNPNLLSQWQTSMGWGYMLDMSDPTDIGGGLYEMTVTVGNLPQNRLIGQSMNYTYRAQEGLLLLYSITLLTVAQVLTEYSLTPLGLLRAPLLYINYADQIIPYGDWNEYSFTQNGTVINPGGGPIFGCGIGIKVTPLWIGALITEGTIVVGQDSKCDIYKSGIYTRETWFVTYPNIATLNN